MKIRFKFKKETKTCCVFTSGEHGTPTQQTIYLKTAFLHADGIDPYKDIDVEVKEADNNA